MTTLRFTEKQMNWYHSYEAVRDTGLWNMWDRRAQESAGLATEEYTFVMTNYSEMRAQANEPS